MGRQRKRKTLTAGATSYKRFNVVPASLPAETTKDQIQIKVEYYKDSAYTSLLGYDAINFDMYVLIQQSDMTWGSPTNNLDESVVVYDDFVSFTISGNTAYGKNKNVKAYYEYSLGSSTGWVYDYLLKASGYYSPKRLYFQNVSDSSTILDKLIVFLIKANTSAYPKYIEVYNTALKKIVDTYGFSTTLLKVFFPAINNNTIRIYQNMNINGPEFYIDGLVVFNKF